MKYTAAVYVLQAEFDVEAEDEDQAEEEAWKHPMMRHLSKSLGGAEVMVLIREKDEERADGHT